MNYKIKTPKPKYKIGDKAYYLSGLSIAMTEIEYISISPVGVKYNIIYREENLFKNPSEAKQYAINKLTLNEEKL